MPRELLYPCFLTCVEYTEDDYWRNIFEDLSFGITPQGTYISKNYLISNVKNKEFVYKINPDIDSETIFTDMYNLLSEKLGLKSLMEIEDYKNSIESEITFNSWNSIKKKSIKDSIIMNYVNVKSEENNLTTQTSKRLLNTINLGIMLKFITIKHIDYENGVINNIEGFTFSENNFHFDKCLDQGVGTSNVIEYNKVKISLIDIWFKMVDILCKSIYNKLLFK
jgi:hypothetical protein